MFCDKPLVCICMPNFNNEATLSETLDSLLSQTYSNILIKVFDNASTDLSLEILNQYARKYSNIKVYKSEYNIGGEANFTRCIENMEGEFSAIYHSDDVYMSTIVEEQVAVLSKHENVSAVFTNSNLIDSSSKIIGRNFYPKSLKSKACVRLSLIELLKLTISNENFLICPTAMAKTSIYRKYISVWSFSNFDTASDVGVWFRLAEKADLMVINKPLIHYRLSNNSFSYKNLRRRVVRKDLFKVLDFYMIKYKDFLSDVDFKNYKYIDFKENVLLSYNALKYEKIIFHTYLDIFNFDILLRSFKGCKFFFIYVLALFFVFFVFPLKKNKGFDFD
ncbi:glycosyltransferase family 2 protein [Marinomonas sp. C2222]|uniref:Glycosyltransferase family 2 protein n=1 Tax=Marinomonas sargassi TaxID=2984494 RepID=A0ABT2YP17_9GAMM|nr:glycosyltransferase family 2 protein [Marinomonas sargassi]MCV2401635.1 glycosyltransferase family 2 protein [Marinomonas sargassi]